MDPSLLFFGAIILVIVLMMFRNGRKRQKDQLALSEGTKPGAEIMTTFGLYGTIVSVDDEENKIVLATGPGSEVTIHRQALGRIVTPVAVDEAQDIAHGDVAPADEDAARVEGDAARGSAKSSD